MSNIYEPKRLNGKLVAKNIDTGSIAPESLIRYIQIRNAEKNNQVLAVNPETGSVTRLDNVVVGSKAKDSKPAKLSFMTRLASIGDLVFIKNMTFVTF